MHALKDPVSQLQGRETILDGDGGGCARTDRCGERPQLFPDGVDRRHFGFLELDRSLALVAAKIERDREGIRVPDHRLHPHDLRLLGQHVHGDVCIPLEEAHLPFTGANSAGYDPTREEMQAAAERCQIGFARGGHVTGVPEAEALSQSLRYPLMVKHPSSFGSTGMTRKSRVKSVRALQSQVKRICEKYGSARVEEFIDGREFTVLVCDNPDDLSAPYVYPPAEIIFPEGETFLHVHVKWRKWVYLKPVPDETLAERLMTMTRKMYLELNGTGYARADIRLRDDGELVMIEINPNPGILFKPEHFGPADVAITYDREGHHGFFERIFRSAVMRRNEKLIQYSISNEVAHADLRFVG